MRVAYLDCFAGISGDMFLGALIDAGVDPQILQEAAASMGLDASIRIERADRSGIASTKVHVLEGGRLAETVEHQPRQEQAAPVPQSRQPEAQHLHKTGPAHDHGRGEHTHGREMRGAHAEEDHPHAHGRSLTTIRRMIEASKLSAPVIHTAIRTFELLGASEAKIHNVGVEEIHFHEVGAVDAIIDVVGASAGLHALGIARWVASPLNVGGGMVDCAHGRFPVPAPATADLLRGLPTYSADIQMELVTPTGAALVRALVEGKGMTFGPQPAMRVERIGYGAGTRNPKGFPNVLRLSVGESEDAYHSVAAGEESGRQTVMVLETALDDLSPQLLAHVAEAALQQGAMDVMLTPVIMKKGRPGTLLTILCNPGDRSRFEELMLRETSTLGLRIREDHRVCIERSFQTVETIYGAIKIKMGTRGAEILNANPEFVDCQAAAAAHGVPLKQVHQAATAAYVSGTETRSDRSHHG